MKKLAHAVMVKRKIWHLRFEMWMRKIEHWLDEHESETFYGFVMFMLFLTQLLLFLS